MSKNDQEVKVDWEVVAAAIVVDALDALKVKLGELAEDSANVVTAFCLGVTEGPTDEARARVVALDDNFRDRNRNVGWFGKGVDSKEAFGKLMDDLVAELMEPPAKKKKAAKKKAAKKEKD